MAILERSRDVRNAEKPQSSVNRRLLRERSSVEILEVVWEEDLTWD